MGKPRIKYTAGFERVVEAQARQKLEPVEREANAAADAAPAGERAAAFAAVLRSHGLADVDEGALRQRFGE